MIKKVIAFALVILLFVPMNYMVKYVENTTVLASEMEKSIDVETTTTDTAILETTDSTSVIKLMLEWENTEFKNATDYNLKEDRPVTNAVKMKVTYSSTQAIEKGYKAGELIIVVNGIGNVNRSKTIEALVGADKETSSVKTHDWTYTWNKATDTYTFINNQEMKANSVLSGYFELVWGIEARNSIHEYRQENIKAILYLPDGNCVESDTLLFTNETNIDRFETYIEQGEMYSYEGLSDELNNPDDYAFVRYNLAGITTKNSRGLKSGDYYYFNPDCEGIGTGAIVISPILSYTENNSGTGGYVKLPYDISKISTQLDKQYIFVAYPKDKYSNKNITASLEKYGAYFEGDEEGNIEIKQLAVNTITIPILSDFKFTDLEGTLYDFWKETYYDKYISSSVTQIKGGDIKGSKMKTGTVETFYLEGSLRNQDGISYTLEFVDDFLYILKNNGEYRQLEADEYEFKQVVIPGVDSMINLNGISIEENKYYAFVYAVTDGNMAEENQCKLVCEKLITTKSQKVVLPDNTTAIVVVFKDIEESIEEISIEVKVEFHIKNTSTLEKIQQDNLTNGQVVNTSFIKLYDSDGVWINDKWTEDNYIDDTNLNLAQKDIDIYGSYLDRERDNITFYDGDKNDYKAYTRIYADENSLKATFTMGAEFAFVEDDYPNQFSLYSILPEGLTLSGYTIEEDIWNIITLYGLNCSAKMLSDACTPEIIINYRNSGRTYIALHFDFGDTNMEQNGTIEARFQVKLDEQLLKINSNIFVRSCVIIDDSISEYTVGKVKDNGSWGESAALFEDIDNDGDIEKYIAYGYSYRYFVYADSSQFQLTKYVKTTYSDEWVQLPDVPCEEYGGDYQYKLSITNGNNISSNIVVMDLLEAGENTQWKGTLQSVDLSQCEILGLEGTVYYSTTDNPNELGSNDWSREISGDVKVVAVDFGESILKEGEELVIIINMRAPKDMLLKNKVTENGFSASLTMLDSTTENVTIHDSLASNFVQVRLTPILKTIVVTKIDAEDKSILSGAILELISKSTGEIIEASETNERGYAIFHNVPSDDTYIIKEIKAPYGYELTADVEVIMNMEENIEQKVIYVTVEDMRKTGIIEVYKTNNLDETIKVSGAEYTLYDLNGNVVNSAITDEHGKAIFCNLNWGTYRLKETRSPIGYQLNEIEYVVEITRDNVSKTIVLQTEDIQDDVSVHLVKYAKNVNGVETEQVVSGATFELVKVNENGNKRVGLYVTNTDGKIEISGLSYGDYYFREYRTPLGYESEENVSFTVSPENKDVTITFYNKRSAGRMIVLKKDNLGNVVSGAKFILYDSTKSVVLGSYVTDEYGVIQIEGLEWGTYYLLETEAPLGYKLDNEWKKVIIDANNLEVIISCINETLKGKIVLTKTNEDETIALEGAEYALYSNDGILIQEGLATEKNGRIIVENLEWGTYYFKETIAPIGYGLSNEIVRFSVNILNAGVTQYLNVTDPVETRTITLTKSIKADEINFDNGNPTFLFKVEGVDIHDNNHMYYRIISFDKAYVETNTDANGYVCQSVTISSLIAGEYTATEAEHSRYYLYDISNVVNGTVNKESVTFELINNIDACATFTNLKYENQGFSDNQAVTNILKKQTKLTALNVSYGVKKVKAKSKVDRTILEVIALYDDGSATVLDDMYTLSIEKFPDENGDYTVTVSYEENGIIRTGDFTVTITEANSYIVSLKANLKEDVVVHINSEITPNMFDVIAVYSSGLEAVLDYNALEYVVSPDIAPEVEGEFAVTICLNPEVFTNEKERDVNTTIKLVAEEWEAVLKRTFKSVIPTGTTEVIFTDEIAPDDVTIIDVSAENNGMVVAWSEDTTMYVSSQKKGKKIMAPANCSNLFLNKKTLKKIDLSTFDTSNVTNMYAMFSNCIALEELNLGQNFNTSNVQNMERMFYYCKCIKKLDFGDKFDTAKVVNMDKMFYYCSTLTELDMSFFNTSEVLKMYGMFYNCASLIKLDLSSFITEKCTDMRQMFANCEKLETLDVSNFDTSQVTSMGGMFYYCFVLKLDCSNWNVDKVTNYSNFNANAPGVVRPIWVN